MRALVPPPLVVWRPCWVAGRPQRPTLFRTHGARAGVRSRWPARPACANLPRVTFERHHEVAPPVKLI
eukprot:7364148-Alexandrium_andersonii.AAC.1